MSETEKDPAKVDHAELADRLHMDPNVSGDSPTIKGTWVTVAMVVNRIVDGYSWAEILQIHPEITEDDLRACLCYSAENGEAIIPPAQPELPGDPEPSGGALTMGKQWRRRRDLVIFVACRNGLSERLLADVFDLPRSRVAEIVKAVPEQYDL